MADVLMSADFWRKVRRALHPSGAICINAWSGDVERLNTLLELLERWVAPGGSIFQVDHIGFGNVVIFATPQPLERSAMLKRAQRIDELLSPQHTWTRSQRREATRVGLSGESVLSRLTRGRVINAR